MESKKQRTQIFDDIYESGEWTTKDANSAVSESGLGSNLRQTQTLRSELPGLFEKLGVRSLLDIPCGDFYWMSHVPMENIQYIGADIVPMVVQRNNTRFSSDSVSFQVLDLVEDSLPPADLIFTRDCLVHLSISSALKALDNIRGSSAKFLAATTFAEWNRNKEITTGGWRPLNLQLPPFGLPDPDVLINEQCTERYDVTENGRVTNMGFEDKSIGIWKIADIKSKLK